MVLAGDHDLGQAELGVETRVLVVGVRGEHLPILFFGVFDAA